MTQLVRFVPLRSAATLHSLKQMFDASYFSCQKRLADPLFEVVFLCCRDGTLNPKP